MSPLHHPSALRPSRLSIALSLAFAGSLATSAAFADITDLSALNGGTYSGAYGISADGSVVVGYAEDGNGTGTDSAFRWTQQGGMVSLGYLNGGWSSNATGVSADGSVVVGNADDGAAGHAIHAFRWTQQGGMVSLGTISGGGNSFAKGVSADGSVVVGNSADTLGSHAFRWTQAGGMADLGVLNGGSSSYAYGVNADGSVVVGYAQDGAVSNIRAFRWTQAGMVSLGVVTGDVRSYGYGVNADGSVVVGESIALNGDSHAFRWTQAGGMVSLGMLNGGTQWAVARGVSTDGNVVVGQASADPLGNQMRAFRWTQATGMLSVEDWLRAAGVNVPVDITDSAYATNSDGSVVVGTLANGYAFIARVATPGSGLGGGTTSGTGTSSGLGSGLITLADLQNSLVGSAHGGSMALSSSATVINGAHSRPLMRRVESGQNTFWIAGDWGRDDHGSRDGNLGLAELGLGRNFGPVQINVSLGQTWAKQNQVLGGSTQTDGTYLLTEALIPVSGNLWGVLGAHGHWGTADIRRGYFNAGVHDHSISNPDVDTWGLRGRLEWDAFFRAAGAEFSPYADLAYTRSKLDAYTETGGGFPARFDARTDKATELRLGVDAAKPLSNGMTLTGIVEAAHRFEKSGAGSSGQVLGLFAFNLPGQHNQQNWLRAGAGVEGKLADGKASLTLNLTSGGETPNAWLAVNWQKSF